MKPFQKWLFLILTIWGVPAIILWVGAGTVLQLNRTQATQEKYDQIEETLGNLSEKLDKTNFFQTRLTELYKRSLKGLFAKKNLVEQVIRDFLKPFPKGLFSFFVFDSEGKLIPCYENNPDSEIVFNLVRKPWTEPLDYQKIDFKRLLSIAPSPEIILKTLKGRPEIVHTISRNPRATWGFFEYSPEVQTNRIAGMLALIHQEALPQTFILDQLVLDSGSENFNFGYWKEGEKPVIPKTMDPGEAEKIISRYRLEPGSHYECNDFLAAVSRIDSSTLIMGISKKADSKTGLIFILFPIYFIFSYLLLINSYRDFVLGKPFQVPVKVKILSFFSLSFALPIIVASLLAWLYLSERKPGIKEDFREAQLQKLTKLDTGFDQFLNRRLRFYRRLGARLKKNVNRPDVLVDILNDMQSKWLFDTYYLVSSQSQLLGEYRYFPSELKRHIYKPLNERLEFFNSLIYRGFNPSPFQIKKLTEVENHPEILFPEETWEMDKKVFLFITQSAETAINEYNLSNNIAVPKRPKASELAFQSIMETEGKSLFQAVRTHLSDYIPMEGTGEYSRSFFEILPGPNGAAWYSLFLFHDILALERDYFRKVFNSPIVKSERTSYFAASLHPVSPNFPTSFEFKRFDKLMKRLENSSRNNLSLRMAADGAESEVCALRCSFLKRYFLFSVTPVSVFDEQYQRLSYKVLGVIAGLIIFGLSIAGILIQRFIIPLSYLFESLNAMNAKNFEYRIPVVSTDELGELCRAFNEATANLKDMELASAVQADLLPREKMNITGFELFGKNIMTQSVGGDYFDFIPLQKGLTAIILGDVSGHGVSAALVTAMAKAAFSILCPRFPEQPEIILKRINTEFLVQLNRAKMMTCFLGILDSTSSRMICSNAGQSYPVRFMEAGEPEQIVLPSIPLGIRANSKYKRLDIDLKDVSLVIFSDGLIEAMNENQKMFGYDAFTETARRALKTAWKEPMEIIFEDVRKFTGQVPWGDDATVVIVRKI